MRRKLAALVATFSIGLAIGGCSVPSEMELEPPIMYDAGANGDSGMVEVDADVPDSSFIPPRTCPSTDARIPLTEEAASNLYRNTVVEFDEFCLPAIDEFIANIHDVVNIRDAYDNAEVRDYYDPSQTYIETITREGIHTRNLINGSAPATANVEAFKHLFSDAAILLHEIGAIGLWGNNFAAGTDLGYIATTLTTQLQENGYTLTTSSESDGSTRTYIDERWVGALEDMLITNREAIENWITETYTSTNDWLSTTQFTPLIDPTFTPTPVKRLHLARELRRMYGHQALLDEIEAEGAFGYIAFTTNIVGQEQGGITLNYADIGQNRAGIVMIDTGVFSHEFGHLIDLTDITDDKVFFFLSYNSDGSTRSDAVPEDFIGGRILPPRAAVEDFANTYGHIAKFGFTNVRDQVSSWASDRLLQKIDWMEENVFPRDYICIISCS